jgi:hypothetical protein
MKNTAKAWGALITLNPAKSESIELIEKKVPTNPTY